MSGSDNVIELDVWTKLDIPPDKVLLAAQGVGMQDVIVIGWDGDGEFYIASSKANGPELLWMLQLGINKLMGQG